MRRPLVVPSARFQKVQRGEAGLNEYIGLDPLELAAAARVAANLYEQGRVAEGRAIFEGMIALEPHFYLGYAGLGAIDLIEDRLDSALANLTRAAGLNPGDAYVQTNLGEVLLRRADFAAAARCLHSALVPHPSEDSSVAARARAIIQGIPDGIVSGERIRGRRTE